MKGLLLVIALGAILVLSLAAMTLVIHRSPALEATGTPCADLDGDGAVTLADEIIEIGQYRQDKWLDPPANTMLNPQYKPQADLFPIKAPDGLIRPADIAAVVQRYHTTTTCQLNPIGPKGTTPPTPTPGPSLAEMSLTVSPSSSFCGVSAKPTKCTVALGSPFTLSVQVNAAPAGGYVGFQTQVYYGSLALVYKPAAGEVVWPGVSLSARVQEAQRVNHDAATGNGAAPLPVSTYTGNILDLQLTCPGSGEFTVGLVLYVAGATMNPFGTTFFTDNYWTRVLPDPVLPNAADNLTINCVTSPTNSDGDGCTNAQEIVSGANAEKLGGNRNPNNFWDFADMPILTVMPMRDKRISISDISAVIQRYRSNDNNGLAAINRNTNPLSAPPPAPAYHPAFDRKYVGPNGWNLGPPDGKILIDDVSNVINQYRHHCN